MKTTTNHLELRKELDNIMLHLDQHSPEKALAEYIKAGALMVKIGILHEKDKENISQIVHTYKNHTTHRLTKIIKKQHTKQKK